PFHSAPGIVGRLGAGLRDGPGWRAVAYLLLNLPVAVMAAYALAYWVTGLINMSYPLWWGLFRNHPPNVRLSPVPVVTPFGNRLFDVSGYAAAVGALLVLAAPWLTGAVTAADRWLVRELLGPGRLVQRVHQLEQTRALAV